jgi:septum formation topological specificity factor MinE
MIERDEYEVPADAIEALARQLLPAIRLYFESNEGKTAFREWTSQQAVSTVSASAEIKPGS